MNEQDYPIYDGKSFKDLCKDIVLQSESRRNQIDLLVSELRPLVKSVNDAMVVVPLIAQYLEVGVKNDEQLSRLAAVVQRLMASRMENTEEGFGLSSQEIEELRKEIEDTAKVVSTPIKVVKLETK
jgi:polyhydroxyalkanoate synthesis regulator protein